MLIFVLTGDNTLMNFPSVDNLLICSRETKASPQTERNVFKLANFQLPKDRVSVHEKKES